MDITNHPSREDLTGYSLQALAPSEAQAVEEHISTCPECRQLLADYAVIANSLPLALPPQAPPPQLRTRLAESIAVGRPVRSSPRRRFHFSALTLSLGLAALVLLFATVVLAFQVRNLQQEQATLINMLHDSQSELALVSEPGVNILPLKAGQVTGNVLISADGKNGILFLRGLPALDQAHSYQVWLIPAQGAPKSAGLLQPGQGQPYITFSITSQVSMKDFAAMGVTVEPFGGSPAPTTKPILVVNL